MSRTTREETMRIRSSVLGYLADRAGKGRTAKSVSYREMSKALGFSEGRVRHACRQLAADDLLRQAACFAEDGGQRPNSYAVTPKGWKFVRQTEAMLGQPAHEAQDRA